MTRVGVVTFPGTCDDRDALRALAHVGAEGVRLWHSDSDLDDVRGVLIPGGFSYGDYLRCGALASHSPLMGAVRAFAESGGPVLGICNGFQVACEAGLLPGVLRPNHHGKFNCRDVDLVVDADDSPWTGGAARGTILRVPIKHHDGAWFAPDDQVDALAANGQLLLRYCDNPNGTTADVAGVTNAAGNVLGLMPHPEHAVDALLGPLGGLPILRGLVELASRPMVAA